MPDPEVQNYLHIDTGGEDASPDGGLMKRMHPQQPITNYVNVPSVTESAAKVGKLGGKVCVPKTAVPANGLFRRLPGHGGQHLRPVGKERKGKIIVLIAFPHSSYY